MQETSNTEVYRRKKTQPRKILKQEKDRETKGKERERWEGAISQETRGAGSGDEFGGGERVPLEGRREQGS